MAESETTRTDDETYLEPTDTALIGVPVVTAEFARQLERELHLKDQKIAQLERADDITMTGFRKLEDMFKAQVARAESLNSQLAAAQKNARRNTLRELSRELNKLKWIGSDDGWDMAIRSVREHIDASIDAAQGDPS